MDTTAIDDIFGKRITLPDSGADERLARLIGLDDSIERLSKILEVLIFPDRMERWRKKHHPAVSSIFQYANRNLPLIIIAGDVGTGKTELSETIGSRVARKGLIEITLFPLSLSARGTGLVGEMTKLISSAFDCIQRECEKISKAKDGSYSSGVILLIDEADAIAQSREGEQMHHEDRAGVNALIRGLDTLNRFHLPVAVLMCTNRLQAVDPAITRRAADVFVFSRPDKDRRLAILKEALEEIGLTNQQIEEVADITGSTEGRDYGFTFSDITQRLFHAIIMSAYPNKEMNYEQVISIAKQIKPTPPFQQND